MNAHFKHRKTSENHWWVPIVILVRDPDTQDVVTRPAAEARHQRPRSLELKIVSLQAPVTGACCIQVAFLAGLDYLPNLT